MFPVLTTLLSLSPLFFSSFSFSFFLLPFSRVSRSVADEGHEQRLPATSFRVLRGDRAFLPGCRSISRKYGQLSRAFSRAYEIRSLSRERSPGRPRTLVARHVVSRPEIRCPIQVREKGSARGGLKVKTGKQAGEDGKKEVGGWEWEKRETRENKGTVEVGGLRIFWDCRPI